MKCSAHPDIDTNLACGRCGTPICPKCLVQTPVGARCSKCAGLKRLPTYEISLRQYLKVVGVGLGFSIVLGIAWAWLWGFVSFFNFLLAIGVGCAVAEVLSLSANRKRTDGFCRFQLLRPGGFGDRYLCGCQAPGVSAGHHLHQVITRWDWDC